MTIEKTKLYAHVVLDRSGSMLANRSATLAAYNQYVEGLPDDSVVSLTTFSTDGGLKQVRTNCTKAQAKVRPEEYECVGGTPLYDAIGTTIQMIDTAAKEFDRVALVIQTDGEETSSKEFTAAHIKQLLTDKQEGEGWLVIFIGAGMEAYSQAEGLGFSASNAINALNPRAVYAATSRATLAYAAAPTRAEGRARSAYTTEERARSK